MATTTDTVSPERVERCRRAAIFAHLLVCPDGRRRPHRADQCRTGQWLFSAGTLEALEYLDGAPRDAAGARGILHDHVCMSGCQGAERDDHARRTQTKTVAALRKFRATETGN